MIDDQLPFSADELDELLAELPSADELDAQLAELTAKVSTPRQDGGPPTATQRSRA